MELRRQYISKNAQGFTYAEIILAMGLLAVLLATAVPVGIGYLRTHALVVQRDTLMELLLVARNRALTHIGQGWHGLYVDDAQYVLFQGAVFTAGLDTNEVTTLTESVHHEPASAVVMFAPLSGQSNDITITLQSNGHSTSVHVNAEGAIE